MTRFCIHAGLHKTGTSYLQSLFAKNVKNFPDSHQVFPGSSFEMKALRKISLMSRKMENLNEVPQAYFLLAQNIGQSCAGQENVLISNEDILGCLPSRQAKPGLYPFCQDYVKAFVDGLTGAENQVEMVVYYRNYSDWLKSLYCYSSGTENLGELENFKAKHGLPDSFDEVKGRLRRACQNIRLHEVSFEADRNNGWFGSALFDIFGTDPQLRRTLKDVPPKKVTDPQTAVAQYKIE